MTLAFLAREHGQTIMNAKIQADRDVLVCKSCGHSNVSHGYGDTHPFSWPEGTRTGLGACGKDTCDCTLFELPQEVHP